MTCVSVERPENIAPAVSLIRSTLRRISFYDKYPAREISRNQFKNSVAIDCEFRQYPPEEGMARSEDNFLVACMTVCVDKILVVNFHIIHMIVAGDPAATVRGVFKVHRSFGDIDRD